MMMSLRYLLKQNKSCFLIYLLRERSYLAYRYEIGERMVMIPQNVKEFIEFHSLLQPHVDEVDEAYSNRAINTASW